VPGSTLEGRPVPCGVRQRMIPAARGGYAGAKMANWSNRIHAFT
jgi:hypothetical protein